MKPERIITRDQHGGLHEIELAQGGGIQPEIIDFRAIEKEAYEGICVEGNGIQVWVRQEDGQVMYSSDGWATQQIASLPEGFKQSAIQRKVVFGNGRFAMAGTGLDPEYGDGLLCLLTSEDGKTWTKAPLDWSDTNFQPVSAAKNILFVNGKFVLVVLNSTNPALWISEDFHTWNKVTHPMRTILAIAGGNGRVVLLGTDASRNPISAASEDWTTWTSSDPNPFFSGSPKIISENGVFVARSSQSGKKQLACSSDGISWGTTAELPGAPHDLTAGNGIMMLTIQGYVDGKDTLQNLMTSTDGAVWTDVALPTSPELGIKYGVTLWFGVCPSISMVSQFWLRKVIPLGSDDEEMFWVAGSADGKKWTAYQDKLVDKDGNDVTAKVRAILGLG